jgi:membrane-bound ClpP family serine protease
MDIWVALLLVSFGLLFLVLEVFVFPGVGISGLVGILALGAGVTMAFMQDTYLGMLTLGGSLIGTSILIYLSIKFDTFSIMSLSTQIDSKVQVNHLKELKVNDEGVTISRLAPMGKARFGNMYSEVSSWNGYVEENTPIKIEKIKDNTIFVTSLI